jgi:tetratricopeptide (TPR) repeat protein
MLLKALLVEDAQNPDYRLALARCDLDRWEFLQSAAFLIPRQSNPASAEESEAMLRSLAQEFPSSPRYRFELADALGRRARGFFELSGEERKSRLLEAVGIAKTLTAAYPRVSGYQNLEARSYHDLAVLLKSLGETEEAERLFENAREIQSRLAEENPTSSFYQVAWAQMLLESSNWQREKGDQKAAELSLNEALAVAERSAPSWGKDPFFRGFLAQLRRRAHAEP